MQAKNKNLLIRKTLYGLMLLMVVFAAFGTPTAQAQESATETLTGATVRLSADQVSFGAAEGVILRVTISNPNGYPIRILKWLAPINGVEGNLFTLTRDGGPVGYIGKLMKRVASTEADYITLAAGESLSRAIDLSTYYDLSVSGKYEIKYNVTSADLYAKENGRQFDIADRLDSNTLELPIEGRAHRVLQEALPAVVVGTNSFVGCSVSRQTDIINARIAASIYAADNVAYFAANKQGARYTTWFGVYDASRYSLVSTHFISVQYAVDNAKPMKFDCTCTDAGVYAYVYPNAPFNIYLCPAFWSAPTTGTDSKAGTLIHEITHFTVVAGTDDYVYGQSGARALAISNPAQAVMNADSHEYFSENNPVLEVGPSTIFTDVTATYWAWSYIERLYNAGVTSGCSTSPLMYCPLAFVTRAEMAVFILRGKYGKAYVPPAATGAVFSDVPIGHPFAAWIEQFAKEGITSGCASGLYCPNDNVTRAQMAIFLLKGKYGSVYVPPVAIGVFSDVPIGSFAADWIEQLAKESITSGCSGGLYCPNSNVTRDQMAVFLVRTFNLP